MEAGIIIIATRSRGGAIGSCRLISTFLDVSHGPEETTLTEISADNGFRPTNIRSPDVWHFPAAEEDEAYEDHATVVQEVGCRHLGE